MSALNEKPQKELPPDAPWEAQVERINRELIRVYSRTIRPLEQRLQYDTFRPSWFAETITQKKPFVTFLGPFSAGKSTFINYLLQGNFLQSGPQPTTDKFTVVMHGDEGTSNIPGRILASSADQPFRGLSQFGEPFLECFGGIQVDHPLLKSVTLVDTPGVLEAGDTHSRRYDYVKVCRWFVERSDLVFVMFDPTKLDAGQELRMLFKHSIRGMESKVRIVLNKADTVGAQDLMRVYGSLYWNLSNLIASTEPPRVYVSSFWDKPYRPKTNHKLFTQEKSDLLYELTETIPLGALDRRVSNMIRRAQDVQIHAFVTGAVKQGMPKLFGKDKAKKEALERLEETYQDLCDKYKLSLPDFPDPDEYRRFYEKVDIYALHRLETLEKEGVMVAMKAIIETELPRLLQPIKSHAAIDPRDKKHAIDMQRTYTQKMQDQATGQQGIQGTASELAANPFTQGLMPQLYQQQAMLAMVQQAQQQQQQQQSQQPASPSHADPNSEIMRLQQQLAAMQQQQQQPAPSNYNNTMGMMPQQQQQQPGNVSAMAMDPNMMAMMQQMMMQQQPR
eukprot:PhM_4_TR17279/c0_g1_i1/m.52665